MPAICTRLARYFDELLVDEVQDFAGHDFNFLLELCAADVSVVLAGDFYQHTFDTSRNATRTLRYTMILNAMKGDFLLQASHRIVTLLAGPGVARQLSAILSATSLMSLSKHMPSSRLILKP